MTEAAGESASGQNAPENFGRYLARERELRGITLAHVAEVTRISVDYLQALEEGRHERLPGKVFVVGYIRSYARCVGLSPDDAVLRYQESVGGSSNTAGRTQPGNQRRWRVAAALLAGAALAAGAVWLFRRRA